MSTHHACLLNCQLDVRWALTQSTWQVAGFEDDTHWRCRGRQRTCRAVPRMPQRATRRPTSWVHISCCNSAADMTRKRKISQHVLVQARTGEMKAPGIGEIALLAAALKGADPRQGRSEGVSAAFPILRIGGATRVQPTLVNKWIEFLHRFLASAHCMRRGVDLSEDLVQQKSVRDLVHGDQRRLRPQGCGG